MIKAIFQVIKNNRRLGPKDAPSVLSPTEQRLYGVVQILEGLMMVVFGKRAPGWTLAVAMWGAERKHEQESVDYIIDNFDHDDDDLLWDGCRHGVVEGWCERCIGRPDPNADRRLTPEQWLAIYEVQNSNPRRK